MSRLRRGSRRGRRRFRIPALLAAVSCLPLLLADPGPAAAWQTAELPAVVRMVGVDGTARSVEVRQHRGYAALPHEALEPLGWSTERIDVGVWRLRGPDGARIDLREGDPHLLWNGSPLQLAREPYLFGESLHLPLQLFLDVLPRRMEDRYAADEARRSIRVTGDVTDVESADTAAARDDGVRVVVIDPGHGGEDPGAMGPSGVKEKDVALALGRALARELEGVEGIEVHLTRDEDVLVPIWRRGEWATEVKGERPGVFISLHANALPRRRATRGFETYFLSEARTEHERRVAANENAPLAVEARENGEPVADADLSFILKELRNLDHQHWSALLAELVQDRLRPVHPGPDRGVKQAPFAVITNALMPAVLVEAGFISNRAEEEVLGDPEFQDEAARGIARAILDFFQRYPPGQSAAFEERR